MNVFLTHFMAIYNILTPVHTPQGGARGKVRESSLHSDTSSEDQDCPSSSSWDISFNWLADRLALPSLDSTNKK